MRWLRERKGDIIIAYCTVVGQQLWNTFHKSWQCFEASRKPTYFHWRPKEGLSACMYRLEHLSSYDSSDNVMFFMGWNLWTRDHHCNFYILLKISLRIVYHPHDLISIQTIYFLVTHDWKPNYIHTFWRTLKICGGETYGCDGKVALKNVPSLVCIKGIFFPSFRGWVRSPGFKALKEGCSGEEEGSSGKRKHGPRADTNSTRPREGRRRKCMALNELSVRSRSEYVAPPLKSTSKRA